MRSHNDRVGTQKLSSAVGNKNHGAGYRKGHICPTSIAGQNFKTTIAKHLLRLALKNNLKSTGVSNGK